MSSDSLSERVTALEARITEIERTMTLAGGVWLAIRWGALFGSGAWGLVSWIRDHVKL